MDPRTFRVPIRCALCDRLLYTLSDMSRHCSTHVVSSTPPTAAVQPRSQPASQPTPVLSVSSPTSAVANSDSASRDQLLRDIDVPSTGTDTPAASSNIPPPFQPQAASTQQHSFVSPDVSPTVGARPSSISYPPGEYRELRHPMTEYKFLLWWCLHHLKSLPAPPPSAGGEFDLALRRVLRRTAITPSQFNKNSSFEDMVTQLHDHFEESVTKFP